MTGVVGKHVLFIHACRADDHVVDIYIGERKVLEDQVVAVGGRDSDEIIKMQD